MLQEKHLLKVEHHLHRIKNTNYNHKILFLMLKKNKMCALQDLLSSDLDYDCYHNEDNKVNICNTL